MTVETLVEKYIKSAKKAIQQIEERRRPGYNAEKVLDHAKRYLEDANYYREQEKFETALTSVAYCEGLLDALRLLGMVEFQWTTDNT